MAKEIIKGVDIVRLWTIGNWADGLIRVYYTQEVKTAYGWRAVTHEVRIHVDTLLPIVQKYDFEVEKKKRATDHLVNPKKYRRKQ